jgi:hypothetical protein
MPRSARHKFELSPQLAIVMQNYCRVDIAGACDLHTQSGCGRCDRQDQQGKKQIEELHLIQLQQLGT